jgi:arylsulfatase
VTPRPSVTAGRTEFSFPPVMTGISNGVAPTILNASYTFTAEVTVPEDGGNGMIITQGGRFAGYGLYLDKGKPTFDWNLVGLKNQTWQAKDALTPGKHTIVFDFKYDGLGIATLAFNSLSGIGQSGTGTLSVDGKVVDTQKMDHTIPIILAWDENMDIGSDTGTPVNDKVYQVPFAFTGTIYSLKLVIDRPQLTDADKAKLEAAMKKAAD